MAAMTHCPHDGEVLAVSETAGTAKLVTRVEQCPRCGREVERALDDRVETQRVLLSNAAIAAARGR